MGRKPNYEGMLAETFCFQGHNGDVIGGYLAKPLGAGLHPGVIVIHDIFGLMVPHPKEIARKFAANGYIALAPDLYARESFPDADSARAGVQASGGIPDGRVVDDLEGAATALNALATCNGKLGCIGYCAGGRQTVLFACNTASLSAAVDCYGGNVVTEKATPNQPQPVIQMVNRISCPLLGLFGEDDQNPSPGNVLVLEEHLKGHGKTYEFHSYPGAGHAFFADYRPSYRQEAAVDGWNHVFNWFEKYLKG